jgi:hypothetical protein
LLHFFFTTHLDSELLSPKTLFMLISKYLYYIRVNFKKEETFWGLI